MDQDKKIKDLDREIQSLKRQFDRCTFYQMDYEMMRHINDEDKAKYERRNNKYNK